MKKKVLVTGAGGFIGSHLTERLVELGYNVKALVKYNSRNSWGWLDDSHLKGEMEIVTGDVRNYDSVKHAMKNVDIVFHLAALIGIPYSYHSPDSYIDVNVRGTLNVLQAAKELNLKKVIHTSTSEVYGSAQYISINELHPIKTQSPYAATKAGADFLALSFCQSFELPVAIVRPFNTFGPRQSARAIIPTIITQILSNGATVEVGSLNPTRDFTYVKDTVAGFIRAAEQNGSTGEVINLGSNFEISIRDLVEKIAKSMGVKIKIISKKERKRPNKSEVDRLHADTQKALRILKWKPVYTLGQGLTETIAWFKTHKDIYKARIYNV